MRAEDKSHSLVGIGVPACGERSQRCAQAYLAVTTVLSCIVSREINKTQQTRKHTLDRISLNNGLRYSADCTCVAAASLPCVERLTLSARLFSQECKMDPTEQPTWPVREALFPLLQSTLQGIVYDGIQSIRIRLQQLQI